MAEAIIFLEDLAVVLIVAAVVTVLFHRLHLPVMLGYLLAGVLVGPATGPVTLVQDLATVEVLGELGVIFLLFGVGLEFNLGRLRRVGLTAIVAGALQAVLLVWLGYHVGRAFGLDALGSLFLGATLSISSTVVIVKLIQELAGPGARWPDITIGILLFEDVLAVLLLTLLSTTGTGSNLQAALLPVLLKLALFLGAAVVLGLIVVPRLVSRIASFAMEEVLVVTALGLGLGMAILAAELGFSPALGAFIMGALIAESTAAARVLDRVTPIRDLFAAIFFVSIGMLLDPGVIFDHAPFVLAVTGITIVGKFAAISFSTFITGHRPATAVRVGLAHPPIGEFSFVIAATAVGLGVVGGPIFEVVVGVALLTTLATPFLIRASPALIRMGRRAAPAPLVTYASLYQGWGRRLRELRGVDGPRQPLLSSAFRTALYAAALVAILVLGAASIDRIGPWSEERLPELGFPARILGWSVVGLVAAPFALLFVAGTRHTSRALAEAATPRRMRTGTQPATAARILQETFSVVGIALLGAVLLAVLAPFAPGIPVLIAVGGVLAVAVALLYRSMVRFQRHVDDTLREVLESDEAGRSGRREELLALVREKYPWDVVARLITIPHGAYCANRRLADLRLRSVTGATVAGLQRGREHLLNPEPSTVLLPGDRVALIGEEPQIEAAALLLTQIARPDDRRPVRTESREVPIAEGSGLVGTTLAGARVRERTGVTVIGLVREGERHLNPPPDTLLEVGDLLVVFGTKEQAEALERLARGG